jgi:hypothetical protein
MLQHLHGGARRWHTFVTGQIITNLRLKKTEFQNPVWPRALARGHFAG